MALGASLCWAITGVISAGPAKELGAVTFVRWRMTLVALALWGYVGLVFPLPQLSWQTLMAMAISGIVGIFVGDSALFAAMNRMGPRRTGVLFATHAIFSAIFGFLFLGERLSLQAYLGALIAVVGVMIAIANNNQSAKNATNATRPTSQYWMEHHPITWVGVSLALLAAVGQAVGALIAKPMMSEGMHPMVASAIRVSSAAVLFWLWRASGNDSAKPRAAFNLQLWTLTTISGFIGMGIGMGLLLWALEKGEVGTVGVLSSLSPLLILPLLWLFSRRRPSAGAWIGAIVALVGVNLVVLR